MTTRTPRRQLGQYAEPRFTIAHLSDTHLLADGKRQYGVVDPEPGLVLALEQLTRLDPRPDAVVVTGDLADLGEPKAYVRLKGLVESTASRLRAQLVWVMGNHDERAAYAEVLLGVRGEDGLKPQDAVHDVRGLRIISLDSSVPGHHHGEIEPAQLAWLREVLSTPAEHGTVLALHHPPVPLPMDPVSQLIELQGQAELAEVLRGTDVRVILAGHMHYSTYATFADIPVMVASASCYTMDLATSKAYSAVDANRAFAMCHLYDEGVGGMPGAPVVHTVVPIEVGTEAFGLGRTKVRLMRLLMPRRRLERLVREKRPVEPF